MEGIWLLEESIHTIPYAPLPYLYPYTHLSIPGLPSYGYCIYIEGVYGIGRVLVGVDWYWGPRYLDYTYWYSY